MKQQISNQETATKNLLESEERLRALLNAPLETIALLDRDGTILSMNESGARRLGHSAEAIIGSNVYDLLPADVARERRLHGDTVFQTGQAVNFDDEREGLYFANTIYPVFGTDGSEVTAVAVFAQDVTEQRVAEEQRRESERRFRLLMEQSPQAIELLSPEGQIQEVNTAWQKLWGLSEEETKEILQSYNMLTDMQTEELGVAHLIEAAFGGKPVVLPPVDYSGTRVLEEIGLGDIEARSRWIQCHLYPVKDAAGELSFVVNTYVDITEQRSIEEDLRTHQRRLRALAAELTLTEERERRRIATELHDGAAQSLAFARIALASLARRVEDETAASKLEDLSQLLKDALQQIREVLLDLSSPALNEIGLAAALSEWLDSQVKRRHGLQVDFEAQISGRILSQDMRSVLYRNARELLTNVLKHAQASRVTVAVKTGAGEISVTVEDDGQGFEPDGTGQESGSGRGFGLFSIQERMADMGGRLEIQSTPGKGTMAMLVAPLRGGDGGESP